jgi:hypothetical protein
MPSRPEEFHALFRNIVRYVDEKCRGAAPAWTHIPQAALTELDARFAAWEAAYGPTLKPSCFRQERHEMKRVLRISKMYLRGFINAWLRYHPAVTSDDKAKMGVPVRSQVSSPIPVPPTRPEFTIRVKDVRTLALVFRDQGSKSRARPYGVSGAVIRWAILDHAPADIGELVNAVLATRSPHVFVFNDEDRGKTVYFAMQWQNGKGQQGKPGEIQWAVVP